MAENELLTPPDKISDITRFTYNKTSCFGANYIDQHAIAVVQTNQQTGTTRVHCSYLDSKSGLCDAGYFGKRNGTRNDVRRPCLWLFTPTPSIPITPTQE